MYFKLVVNKIEKNFKDNDENDKRIMYEMFYQKIFNIAFVIIKDKNLAQEITQETFIKVFRNIETLSEKDKIESWIRRIASRTAMDYYRKRKKTYNIIAKEEYIDLKVQENMIDSTVDRIIKKIEEKEIIRQEIEKLNTIDRKILMLKYEYGLKNAEIASTLEMTVEAVKSRHFRSKIKLRDTLVKLLKDK